MSDTTGVQKFTLSNGVRVLVEPFSHVQSAAVGLWCKTGSRHEFENEAGITHLIEHLLFKGTGKRTAKEIAESIEGRGGMLNAFTDKESTCYYCRTLADDTGNGIDVLTDMMTNSLFDPEEIERESDVVVEEIKRSEDEPGDHVHELHLGHRWGEHPLGKPIIGTRESVKSFTRENIVSYMDRRYRGENILLSVAGNVDPIAIKELAEQTLGALSSGVSDSQPARPEGTAKVVLESKDTEQVHFCIGTDGVSIYDEDEFFTLGVLDSALGGSMSSRIFQEVREKRGLVYSVGSYTLSYGAGGAFTVYGGTSMEKWPTVQEVIRAEFDKVMASGLDDDELERTKTSLCAHLILALEGMSSRMMRMAKSELHHGRHIPIEETRDRIRAVTNDRIVEMARRLLDPSKVSTTAIGPF